MKLAVLFSLASGAILHVVTGNLHMHDLRLFHQLWDCLKRGDILLGDRAYGEYATVAGLMQRAVDVIARLPQARKVDFRKAKRLGKNDGLFTWKRGYQQSGIFNPFKGTLDALRQYSAAISAARNQKMRHQLWQDLLLNLIRDHVPFRPGRSEPRAVKRRPKPYPLLNKPRRKFKEIPHRSRYCKNSTMNA